MAFERLTRWWQQRFPRPLTLGEVAVGRRTPMPRVDPLTQRLQALVGVVQAWVSVDTTREIRALLADGADPQARFIAQVPGRTAGQLRSVEVTPLDYAVRRNLWDLLLLLLEGGARIQGEFPVTEQTWLTNEALPHPSSSPAAMARTMPLWAAMVARADEQIRSYGGADQPRNQEVLEVVDAALDAGAPVDLVVFNTTLLQQLVMCDVTLARWDVKRLARMGVHAVDAQGRNAMATLWGEDTRNNSVTGFSRLLNAGVDPYLEDVHGTTPLHALMAAVDQGQVRDQVVLDILREHPDLEIGRPNRMGITPLMVLQQATTRTGHLSDVLVATAAVVRRAVEQESTVLRHVIDAAAPAPTEALPPVMRERARL